MNYGTVIDNQLHTAPRALMLHGAMVTNPKAEHFAALNAERATHGLPLYYPISNDPAPTPPDGKIVRFDGYAVVSGWITPQYSFVDAPPPPPRTFDKYSLVNALMNAGVWDHVEAWLKETPNAWTRALMAPDISEDEQLLKDGIGEMKKLLGWTDEQVEAVLAASVQ